MGEENIQPPTPPDALTPPDSLTPPDAPTPPDALTPPDAPTPPDKTEGEIEWEPEPQEVIVNLFALEDYLKGYGEILKEREKMKRDGVIGKPNFPNFPNFPTYVLEELRQELKIQNPIRGRPEILIRAQFDPKMGIIEHDTAPVIIVNTNMINIMFYLSGKLLNKLGSPERSFVMARIVGKDGNEQDHPVGIVYTNIFLPSGHVCVTRALADQLGNMGEIIFNSRIFGDIMSIDPRSLDRFAQ